MNKLFLILTILLASTAWASGPVPLPTNWYDLTDSEVNENFKANETKLGKFGNYLSSIYDTQAGILKEVGLKDQNSTSKWKMTGYKTDLVLSYSGLLGFTAVGGKSVAELFWTRVSKGKNDIEDPAAPETIVLNNLMDEDELKAQLEPVVAMAMASGKVKNEKKLRKNMLDKAIEVHKIISTLDPDMDKKWVPFKFRLDMNFGIGGNLFSVVDLGGAFRVRLEWAIKKNLNNSNDKGLFSIFRSKEKKRISAFRKLVKHLAIDAEKATESLERKSGYKLAAINFGMALTKKSFFGIANSKATAVGLIFFKKIEGAKSVEESELDGEYSLAGDEDSGQKLFGQVFKRKRFRKGLSKAVKIADYFASRAQKNTTEDTKWVLKKIRIAFVLSYSGIFGLSNTSAAGIHNIILVKN